jgi:DNA primase
VKNIELEEILGRVDMGAYLDREGIRYRETRGTRGLQFNIKDCPVCGNSDWKVYMNVESGLGNCFSGKHQDAASSMGLPNHFNKWVFIKSHLGTAPAAAVIEHIKHYAREQGWRPARKVSAPVSMTGPFELPSSYPLPWKGRNLPYLENRRITKEYAEYFHLRYAPDGAYYRYKDNDEWRFQFYSRRVLIPIYDLDGKLCTFQGRDTTGKQDPKYLFPPMLEATGVHLFNGFNVPRGAKSVIAGEGAFDVAAIKIAFDQDQNLRDVTPIGTFGKHLSHGGTNDQLAKFLELKARGVEEVTFMWDGEVEATDDAIAAGMLLKSHGFRVRISMLPANRDPNEVVPEVVRTAYYQATLLDLASSVRIKLARRRMNGSA